MSAGSVEVRVQLCPWRVGQVAGSPVPLLCAGFVQASVTDPGEPGLGLNSVHESRPPTPGGPRLPWCLGRAVQAGRSVVCAYPPSLKLTVRPGLLPSLFSLRLLGTRMEDSLALESLVASLSEAGAMKPLRRCEHQVRHSTRPTCL